MWLMNSSGINRVKARTGEFAKTRVRLWNQYSIPVPELPPFCGVHQEEDNSWHLLKMVSDIFQTAEWRSSVMLAQDYLVRHLTLIPVKTEIRHELITQRSSFFVFMSMALIHNDKIMSVPVSVCSSTCVTSKLLNEFELNFILSVHTKFGSCV
jgi:hypothetical protein